MNSLRRTLFRFRLSDVVGAQRMYTSESSAKCSDSKSDQPIELTKNPYEKDRRKCMLCKTGVELDYKNSRLLQQFVSSFSGRVYDRHITGLCDHQQNKLVETIAISRKAGYMPILVKDPTFTRMTLDIAEMSGEPIIKEKYSRAYFADMFDNIVEPEVKPLLMLLRTLENDDLEMALTSLCSLIGKCSDSEIDEIRALVYQYMIDPNSKRVGRRACLSVLSSISPHDSKSWTAFQMLCTTLEEPQFHIILPVLPKFDVILDEVSKDNMEWRWAHVVFSLALFHTNGWVRLWALQKGLEVSPRILARNQDFITDVLFPGLNSNDALWRLLERQRLSEFVSRLGSLIEDVLHEIEADDVLDSREFVRHVFVAVNEQSSPLCFFFLADALQAITARPVFSLHDVSIFRVLIQKMQHIQFNVPRAVTLYRMTSLFARTITWSPEVVVAFGPICASFARQAPGLFEELKNELWMLWKNGLDTIFAEEIANQMLQNEMETESFILLWWLAESSGIEELLLAELSLMIIEAIGRSEDDPMVNEQVDRLVAALTHGCSDHDSTGLLASDLLETIHGHILFRTATFNGKPQESRILKDVYVPFVKKFSPRRLSNLAQAVQPFGIEVTELHYERRVLLCQIIAEEVRMADSEDSVKSLLPRVLEMFGKDPLCFPRSKKTLLSVSEKDFALIVSSYQTDTLRIISRLLDKLNWDSKETIEKCTDAIDCASAFSAKKLLLEIITRLINEVTDESMLSRVLSCAETVLSEEKKSLNYLPAMELLLKLAFTKPMLQNKSTGKRIKKVVGTLLSSASLNQSAALLLANSFESAVDQIGTGIQWVEVLVGLCVFGPVLKKDQRVLGAASAQIFRSTMLTSAVKAPEMERYHEVVARCRMRAFLVSNRLCERDPSFVSSFVKAILSEMRVQDASSSRSFGMSLAHRQKTRAVSLLLFTTEYLEPTKHKDVVEDVYNACVGCILDPCQQYSIKLIVEWTIVRIALKSENVLDRILAADKVMAKTRIGSISSWLNIIVHIARVKTEKNLAERILPLVVPWCTAQNFAVRCTALAACTLLMRMLPNTKRPQFALVQSIVDFEGEPSGNSRRIVDNLVEDFYFGHLDMEADFCLEAVFHIVPKNTGLPPEELLETSLIQELHSGRFKALLSRDELRTAPSLVYNALSKSASCAPSMETSEASQDIETVNASLDDDGGVQRKVVGRQWVRPDGCGLVVVASLIDKTTNLGGICRTSEIFGVESLVLADVLMAKDQNFLALSMSSENHQHIHAVRPEALLEYLQSMRAKGYTVIAAEQTTDSVPMHEFQFPKKCVLLMGDERQGVPVHLLRCVDKTVEIELVSTHFSAAV